MAAATCLLSLCGTSYALDVNPKMGKPTKEELSMTEYTPDPEAEAVVLYSSTYVSYDVRAGDFKLVTHFKKRIKVLKDDGKEQGDVEILVYDSEDGSKDVLSSLKGATYNLENGKVVKSKLSGDLKNEQRLDQYHVVRKFSMPNVVVGSILEYEYDISSDFYSSIDPWYALEDIPVFYTEYEIIVPEWFKFRTNMTGHQHLTSKREDTNYSATIGGDILNATAVREHFVGQELPRIKDDDFVYCINDYNTKVTKEITNFIVPGHIYESYNQDWAHEIGNLMSSSYFGRLCKGNNPMEKDFCKSIVWPENFSIKQKIDSMRNILWDSYSWNESYNMYARNIRNLDKEKSGNSATLNFALMNMLNDAGIETFPVVMSSRTKGRLPLTPSRKHLNAMVLCSFDSADSAYIYFDAGSKDYPVGSIPDFFLAQKAFRLKPTTKEFFSCNLEKVSKGSEISSVKCSIDNEGLLTGNVSNNYRGMNAAFYRKKFKSEQTQEDFVNRLAAICECEVEDYQITNINNSAENVVENYKLKKQFDINGDHIYINPFIGMDFTSPFKAETRDLPIEFSNNSIVKQNIILQLPDGYEVEEMPQNIRIKTPEGSISARLNCANTGQVVQISYQYNRTKIFYDASQYDILRNFYSTIEQTCNTQLVLKKKQ